VAPPKGVTVGFEDQSVAHGPLDVRYDEKLLPRAVRNLLENAIRACGGGGRVTLHLDRDEREVKIVVKDDGAGVDPGLLPRIFEPYFSTDASGTGLGLPIARRIVEGHGGTIAARNRPGGGLEVTIRIPL
jgi:two-component system sensor histidine kinase FlrB